MSTSVSQKLGVLYDAKYLDAIRLILIQIGPSAPLLRHSADQLFHDLHGEQVRVRQFPPAGYQP